MNREDLINHNLLAYAALFRLENVLRRLIEEECLKFFGQTWVRQKLPQDVRESIKEGLKYSKKIRRNEPIIDSPLSYVDYSQLRQIMQYKEFWREIFSKIFSKQDIFGLLERSEIVRNAVAHNRLISSQDKDLIHTIESEIKRDIGEARFISLLDKTTFVITPNDMIGSLTDYLKDYSSRIKGNNYTYQENNTLTNITNDWWFSESYTDDQAQVINTSLALLRKFGSVPRIPRMSHQLYSWVQTNQLLKALDDAVKILEDK